MTVVSNGEKKGEWTERKPSFREDAIRVLESSPKKPWGGGTGKFVCHHFKDSMKGTHERGGKIHSERGTADRTPGGSSKGKKGMR